MEDKNFCGQRGSGVKLDFGSALSVGRELCQMIKELLRLPSFAAALAERAHEHIFVERAERLAMPSSLVLARAERTWAAFQAGKFPFLAHFYFSGLERYASQEDSCLSPALSLLMPIFKARRSICFFAFSRRSDGVRVRTALTASQVAKDRHFWMPELEELCKRSLDDFSDARNPKAASLLLETFRPRLAIPCALREYLLLEDQRA